MAVLSLLFLGACQAYDRNVYYGYLDAAADTADACGACDAFDAESTPDAASNDAADREGDSANLTVNPSFETMIAPWIGIAATIDRVQRTDAPDGDWVGVVTCQAGDAGIAVFRIDDNMSSVMAFTPGETYTASAMVRAAVSSSVGSTVVLAIRENESHGATMVHTSSSVTLGLTFQPVTLTATLVFANGSLSLYVQSYGGTGLSAEIDQFTLRRVAP